MLIPLFQSRVAAGFPSPADDYLQAELDLQQYLIKNPVATFCARANGDSMVGVGIFNGDLLIIDRSIQPFEGAIVVAAIDGQLTCKILDKKHSCFRSANSEVKAIKINEYNDCVIEGVVVHSVRHHVRAG